MPFLYSFFIIEIVYKLSLQQNDVKFFFVKINLKHAFNFVQNYNKKLCAVMK